MGLTEHARVEAQHIEINVCLSVIYVFLNGWTDCNAIWYRDRLEIWEEDRLI